MFKHHIALLVNTEPTELPPLLSPFFIPGRDISQKHQRANLGEIANNVTPTNDEPISENVLKDFIATCEYHASVLTYAKSTINPLIVHIRSLNGVCTLRLEPLTSEEYDSTDWSIVNINNTEYISAFSDFSYDFYNSQK